MYMGERPHTGNMRQKWCTHKFSLFMKECTVGITKIYDLHFFIITPEVPELLRCMRQSHCSICLIKDMKLSAQG